MMVGVPHGFAVTSRVASVSLSMWGVVIQWCVLVMVVVCVIDLPTVCVLATSIPTRACAVLGGV